MKTITIFYDKENGEIFFEGVSSKIDNISSDSITQMEYERIVGPTTKRIIYTAVNKSNRIFFNYIQKRYTESKELSKRGMIIKLLNLLPKMGCGVPELVDWDEDKGMFKVRIRNCYNTIAYKDSEKPVCYYMSGKIAAIFEVVFNKRVECKENACSAMPQHNYCEFDIKLSDEDIGEIGMPYNIQKDSEEYERFDIHFDEENGRIVFEKDFSIISLREEEATIKREFEGIIGITADTISREIARDVTHKALTDIYKIIIKIVGSFSKRTIGLELLKQVPMRGYGVPELFYFDEKKGIFKLRVKNCYNAIVYRHSEKPVCSLMSGVFTGGGEIIFNRRMECIETKCMAMGDPYCEFEVFEKSRMEKLYNILRDFMSVSDIDGSLIMARDGMLLASYLPENINAERVAMMASTVAGSARRVNDELDRESVNRITVETDDAKLIITRAGENADLIVITKPDIYLGLIFAEIMNITKRIEREI